MNYIDLFSGIGGFALGAQRAGFNWQSHFNSDIEELGNSIVPQTAEYIFNTIKEIDENL